MFIDPTFMLLRSRRDESSHMNSLCMPDVEACLGVCDKAETSTKFVIEPTAKGSAFPDDKFDDILLQRAKVTQTLKEDNGGLQSEPVRSSEPASQTRSADQTRPARQTESARQTRPASELAKRTMHEEYDFEFTYKQPCCSIQ